MQEPNSIITKKYHLKNIEKILVYNINYFIFTLNLNFKAMENKTMKPEESLSIISSMIETEKMRFGENGFIYRFWGWLVVAAATLQYLLIFIEYQHHYFAWFLMLAGGVYTGIYYSKAKNQVQMPLSGKLMAYTWTAIGLNIFIVSFILPQTAGEMLLLFILSFIGIGTIISGAMLRFPIMIVGGISNIFIQSTMFQLVIASAGALLFSAFILYDTQQIIRGGYDSPIEAALSLYLDFFNLFISLLQILGIMNSNDE